MLLEPREQYRAFNAASELVPAGELGGSGGFTAAGIGVEQDDGLIVEGAVEGEERFVASEEAGVGARRQSSQLTAAGFAQSDDKRRGRAPLGKQRDGGGFVNHWHLPILQGPRVVGDGAQRLAGELLAAERHRLSKRLPLRE